MDEVVFDAVMEWAALAWWRGILSMMAVIELPQPGLSRKALRGPHAKTNHFGRSVPLRWHGGRMPKRLGRSSVSNTRVKGESL